MEHFSHQDTHVDLLEVDSLVDLSEYGKNREKDIVDLFDSKSFEYTILFTLKAMKKYTGCSYTYEEFKQREDVQMTVMYYNYYLSVLWIIRPGVWGNVSRRDIEKSHYEFRRILVEKNWSLRSFSSRLEMVLQELSSSWVLFLNKNDIADILNMYALIREKFNNDTSKKNHERKKKSFNWMNELSIEHHKEVFWTTLFSLIRDKNWVKPDRDTLLIALGHDLLEDTNVTAQKLADTFWTNVAIWIKMLTKISHEQYIWELSEKDKELYIERNPKVYKVLGRKLKNIRNIEYLEKIWKLAKRLESENPDDHYLYIPLSKMNDFLLANERESLDLIETYWEKLDESIPHEKIYIRQVLMVKEKDQVHNLATNYDMSLKKIIRKLKEVEKYYLPLSKILSSNTYVDMKRMFDGRMNWWLAEKEYEEKLWLSEESNITQEVLHNNARTLYNHTPTFLQSVQSTLLSAWRMLRVVGINWSKRSKEIYMQQAA